ncbi:hypothetical protein RUND412_003538 [Rhizina undulata]
MPRFRGPRSWRLCFIVIAAVAAIYYLYSSLSGFDYSAHSYDKSSQSTSTSSSSPSRPSNFGHDRHPGVTKIQYQFKENGVEAGDPKKMKAVVETMRKTFWGYRLRAWGGDEIMPISGESQTTRNGWAATIVDTLTTTAIMGLEEEFMLELNYTISAIDFSRATNLVDPFETIIRYLGALVSTIELFDAGILPKYLTTAANREGLLSQAVTLATKLAPAFDSPSGMLWPRVDFATDTGCMEPIDERPDYPNPLAVPARTGSNWLEYKVLSKLTGDPIYQTNATGAWG